MSTPDEPASTVPSDLPLPPEPSGRVDYDAAVDTAAACATVAIESRDHVVRAFAFAQAASWESFIAAHFYGDDEHTTAEDPE